MKTNLPAIEKQKKFLVKATNAFEEGDGRMASMSPGGKKATRDTHKRQPKTHYSETERKQGGGGESGRGGGEL